jgi:hypothetical protein
MYCGELENRKFYFNENHGEKVREKGGGRGVEVN